MNCRIHSPHYPQPSEIGPGSGSLAGKRLLDHLVQPPLIDRARQHRDQIRRRMPADLPACGSSAASDRPHACLSTHDPPASRISSAISRMRRERPSLNRVRLDKKPRRMTDRGHRLVGFHEPAHELDRLRRSRAALRCCESRQESPAHRNPARVTTSPASCRR